jgi:hypothetical protein
MPARNGTRAVHLGTAIGILECGCGVLVGPILTPQQFTVATCDDDSKTGISELITPYCYLRAEYP